MALTTRLQDPPLLPSTKEAWTIHTEFLLDEWRRQTIRDLRDMKEYIEALEARIEVLEGHHP